ncbi:MAG: IclR family transcriptional regulator [Propionibacteriaceae bacterium]|nr:IclR family transcriptional regulator [Propionibacteriaceae bacterium]
MDPKTPPNSGAPAVTRAAAILGLLADTGAALSLTDIARSLGLPKSSTYNLCNALEDAGLVSRHDSSYFLGRRLVELGGAYLRTFDIVREFYRACAESVVLRHELLQLAVLDGTDVLYVARHEGRAPLRLSATIGDRFPASITAVGNILLAQLDPAIVADRYRDTSRLSQWTPNSVATLAGLMTKLQRARELGFAVDNGETNSAVVGIAVLVNPRTSSQELFALGVSLFASDDLDEHRDHVLQELRRVAEELSNPMLVDGRGSGGQTPTVSRAR